MQSDQQIYSTGIKSREVGRIKIVGIEYRLGRSEEFYYVDI